MALAFLIDLVLWGFDPATRLEGQIPSWCVIASGVAVFALLFYRSRWPRFTFLVSLVYCVMWGALLTSYQPFTALLIALYHIARHLPLREGIWFLLLSATAPAISTRDAAAINQVESAGIILIALIWSVIFGLTWTVGRAGQRAALAARWQEEKFAAEAALAVQTERLALARELHDIVAHSIASIIFQAAGARQAAGGNATTVNQSLQTIEVCASRAMQELRELLGLLHTPVGNAERCQLGRISVQELLDLISSSDDVHTTLHWTGKPWQLNILADHAAYRLVQEALTNAMKHGGRPLTVAVRVNWEPTAVEVAVTSHSSSQPIPSDDVVPSGGYGLAGMRYRMASIGATLSYGWQSDSTYVVHARIPALGITTDKDPKRRQDQVPAR